VMALTMLGFEGNFLVSSQLYFHGYEHDPYRLQNQASSLITGIHLLQYSFIQIAIPIFKLFFYGRLRRWCCRFFSIRRTYR
ncbi:hypothetical protein, partial [Candidatus Fukatsuia symbiotica]|uniref:hypothetical protein n=1 Tax=Candidatus Fukatsuia symbiotica TaxID=1878942 RepID=UPI0013C47CC9